MTKECGVRGCVTVIAEHVGVVFPVRFVTGQNTALDASAEMFLCAKHLIAYMKGQEEMARLFPSIRARWAHDFYDEAYQDEALAGDIGVLLDEVERLRGALAIIAAADELYEQSGGAWADQVIERFQATARVALNPTAARNTSPAKGETE